MRQEKTKLNKQIRENKKDDGTLIGLPYSYTVPCVDGAFQEMYYWDTCFTNVGLLLCDRLELAKNNTENMAYMIPTSMMGWSAGIYLYGLSQLNNL